ncbi:MAG: CHAD domain-containing protein [Bacteroidales bacterium]|nr:CHAD domain-containing protein [Bacteroidales bacterium]
MERKMRFRLLHGEGFRDGILRVMRFLHHDIVRLLQMESRQHISVHTVRTHIKRIRSLLRLLRDETGNGKYRELNWFYRDMGRRISAIRDDTSQIELLSAMAKKSQSHHLYLAIRRPIVQIEKKRKREFDSFYGKRFHVQIGAEILEKLSTLEELPLSGNPDQFIMKSLKRVYCRARKAMYSALETQTDLHYHNWRKQVKYLMYQIQFMQGAWPSLFLTYSDELGKLASTLGKVHDLYLFRNMLTEGSVVSLDNIQKRAIRQYIYKYHKRQKDKAIRLGLRIFSESGDSFAERIYGIWINAYPGQKD